MEPARSDSFSYNGRNELTVATLGAAPYGYSYDNIGNRKTAREPAGELAYAANGLNQYTGIEESGEADPHQDVNGRVDRGLQRGQPRGELHQPEWKHDY